MVLTHLQRGFLIGLLAIIIGISLVALSSRVLSPAMPDQVAYRPAPDQPRYILVQLSGAVRRPGLYWVVEGARTAEALTLAGGTTADADTSAVNLAALLHDGDHVYVPTRPAPPLYTPPAGVNRDVVGTATARRDGSNSNSRPPDRTPLQAGPRLNINLATAEQLEALPGVGPVLARRIVDHRQRFGVFAEPGDLQRVKGIGEKKAAALAPYISF